MSARHHVICPWTKNSVSHCMWQDDIRAIHLVIFKIFHESRFLWEKEYSWNVDILPYPASPSSKLDVYILAKLNILWNDKVRLFSFYRRQFLSRWTNIYSLHALQLHRSRRAFFTLYSISPLKQTHLARPQYICILSLQMLLQMLLFKPKKRKGKQNTEPRMKCLSWRI